MLENNYPRKNNMTESAIAFELVIPAAKYFICASTPSLRGINDTLNMIIAVVFVILFILSFHKASINKVKNALLIIGIATVIYLFNYIFYSNARANLSESALKFFGVSILLLVLSVNMDKVDVLFRLLRNGSYLIVLSELVFLFFEIRYGYSSITFNGESYSLALSNFLILPICMLLDDYLSNRKIFSLFGALISLGVGAIYGSRSFILSIVIFCLLYIVYIRNEGRLTNKLVALAVITIVAVILVVIESNNIKKMLLNLYYALGINSRSLHMMLTASFYVSGRDYIIKETILPAIQAHPLVGSGLLGVTGAHNIVLEALVSHGIIIGTLLVVGLAFVFIKKFRHLRLENIRAQIFFIIMFSYAFVDSMTHLSVIGKDYFWVALGLCFINFPRTEKEIL